MEPFDIRIYQAFKRFFNESFFLAGYGVDSIITLYEEQPGQCVEQDFAPVFMCCKWVIGVPLSTDGCSGDFEATIQIFVTVEITFELLIVWFPQESWAQGGPEMGNSSRQGLRRSVFSAKADCEHRKLLSQFSTICLLRGLETTDLDNFVHLYTFFFFGGEDLLTSRCCN